MTKLSETEVNEMLLKLEKHFGEPVKPVSQYCEALELWARAIVKKKPEFDDIFSKINLMIKKSYLLARLIYGGEKFRTKQCPVHKGTWNGSAMLLGDCPHQCDGSGWLREE